MQNSRLRILVPIALLALGVAVVVGILSTSEQLEPKAPDALRPVIRSLVVEPQQVQLVVEANGTETPSTESELVPQVSGEVVWVSPVLAPGGFFTRGEPLVRIDRADYEFALVSAKANVAAAESEFARARKERSRQKQLAERSVASESRIDDAENAYRVGIITTDDAILDDLQGIYDRIWRGAECGTCRLRDKCEGPLDDSAN